MITSQNITIFNAHIDVESRREVYIPTQIRGVSYYENEGAGTSGGIWTESSTYKIRVPYIGAEIGGQYLPAIQYRTRSDVSGYWTLQKGDIILPGLIDGSSMTMPEVREAAKENGLELIVIKEYADNTKRGSDAVKHWRIGGA